jgi:hypothetical protein
MSDPWLSIVLPTYNGQRYLETALGSVAREARDEVEVIAVDDGSTDATRAILRDYQSRLPLRIIERPRVGNWVANTNLGLAEARGRYAGILHQDDLWLPGRLGAMRPLIDRHPEATLVLHPSWFIDRRGQRLGRWRCPLPRHGRPLSADTVVAALLVQNFISMPAPIFPRETALALGGMEPRWRYTADWDFWLKLAAAGSTVYLPRPLSCFRVHAEAQTVQCAATTDTFREQLVATLARHLPVWQEGQNNAARRAKRIERAARYSIEVNTAFAAWVHGRPAGWAGLAWRFARLGPLGWRRYLRNSRIAERAGARLRARLTAREDGTRD